MRARWSAIGAAVAISLGAGGLSMAQAAVTSGEKPVTVTVEPTRILDTRVDLGLSGPFADATPRDIRVTGPVPVAPSGTSVVVPDDAVGVIVNVTVVGPTDGGFLSLRPGGSSGTPSASNVNFVAGVNAPNAATVDLSADGAIQLWLDTNSDSGNADVLMDIVGYTVDHNHDDRYHTRSEVDDALGDKADLDDVYSRTEIDPLFDDRVTNAQLDDAVNFVEGKIADGSGVVYTTGSPRTLDVGSYATIASMPFSTATDGHVIMTATAQVDTQTQGFSSICQITVDGVSRARQIFNTIGPVPFVVTYGEPVTAGSHLVEMECIQEVGTPEVTVIQPRITLAFSDIIL